jgi:hypothetical protein
VQRGDKIPRLSRLEEEKRKRIKVLKRQITINRLHGEPYAIQAEKLEKLTGKKASISRRKTAQDAI